MSMNLQQRIRLIIDAIEGRHHLRFDYHDSVRLAEPQCLGIGRRGTLLLRVHQIQGGVQPEPLFDVAQMTGLEVLDEHFGKPGPNYKRDDSAMQKILCQR